MAPQARVFHKRLAELIAAKTNEEYRDVISTMDFGLTSVHNKLAIILNHYYWRIIAMLFLRVGGGSFVLSGLLAVGPTFSFIYAQLIALNCCD